ncbi:uncharacterized protein O3C94_005633 [Discoglossus pictus]
MGSGSSKYRRRVLKVSGGEPFSTKEVSTGVSADEVSVPCKEKEDIGPKRAEKETKRDNLPVEEIRGVWSKPKDRDEDLQLLDEILAESDHCLSWQESICETLRPDTHNDNSGPELLLQRSIDTIRAITRQSELTQATSKCENYVKQINRENLGKMVLLNCSEDAKNNNLPSLFQDRDPHSPDLETSPITYDDSEEALIHSISQEFSM